MISEAILSLNSYGIKYFVDQMIKDDAVLYEPNSRNNFMLFCWKKFCVIYALAIRLSTRQFYAFWYRPASDVVMHGNKMTDP